MALFLLSSCGVFSHKPEKTVVGEVGAAEGQWRSKALVRDRQNGKTGTLNLEILAKEPAQMRMEISGSMGVYLASFALNGNEVRSIISQGKRFVTAPAEPGALRDLVPIRISPRDLVRVLFERPLPEKEWSCERGSDGLPVSCSHKSEQVRLQWEERSEGKRKIRIESPSADVVMVLEESRSKVELKPEMFELNPPPGYKTETRRASSGLSQR